MESTNPINGTEIFTVKNEFFTGEFVPCGIKYRGLRERNGYFNDRETEDYLSYAGKQIV
ncbi:MAG: hypothetical protein NC312_01910 [Bacteroides fragilis]|nr:hypothetical protein [Bacteroides fragilis]